MKRRSKGHIIHEVAQTMISEMQRQNTAFLWYPCRGIAAEYVHLKQRPDGFLSTSNMGYFLYHILVILYLNVAD